MHFICYEIEDIEGATSNLNNPKFISNSVVDEMINKSHEVFSGGNYWIVLGDKGVRYLVVELGSLHWVVQR